MSAASYLPASPWDIKKQTPNPKTNLGPRRVCPVAQ